MSRTLHRLIPSPAMIVALVALVMSLGGSAYALMITGRSIKNNSVTGKDIRHNTVIGKDIRKRSLRGHDLRANSVGGGAVRESALETVPSASGLEFWAVVRENGELESGPDMVAGNPPSAVLTSAGNPPTTKRESTGNYVVTFDHNVSNCSYQATIGSPDSSYPLPLGEIIVARSGTNALKVRTAKLELSTAGLKATEADRPFQIAVIC
jgi:hypothetical protein